MMHFDAGITQIDMKTLIFAGGVDLPSGEDVAEVYLVSTETLGARPVASLPFPRRKLRLISIERSVYALAGVRELKTGLNRSVSDYTHSLAKYSCDRNTWIELPDMQRGVESPGCCSQAGRLYVSGGCCMLGDTLELLDSVQVYDIDAGVWRCLEFKMPRPLYNHCIVPMTEDALLVFGGLDSDEESVPESSLLTLNGFEPHADMPKGYNSSFTSYTKVHEGNVYAVSEGYVLFSYSFKGALWAVFKTD